MKFFIAVQTKLHNPPLVEMRGVEPLSSLQHLYNLHMLLVPVQCGRNGTAGPQGLLETANVYTLAYMEVAALTSYPWLW